MARIMIVDDDVELTNNTADLLRQKGHEVSTLNATSDAIRKITRDKPDILILDVMFPDNPIAGFDLARQIRCTPAVKDLPIILLTGINQEFPMDFAAKDVDPDWMPVQDFLEKPVKMPALLKTISRLLNAH
ncbi:MAG: response regulator [bacterium]